MDRSPLPHDTPPRGNRAYERFPSASSSPLSLPLPSSYLTVTLTIILTVTLAVTPAVAIAVTLTVAVFPYSYRYRYSYRYSYRHRYRPLSSRRHPQVVQRRPVSGRRPALLEAAEADDAGGRDDLEADAEGAQGS